MSVQPLYLQCIYPRDLTRVILRLPLWNLFSRSLSGIDSYPASQQPLEQHTFQNSAHGEQYQPRGLVMACVWRALNMALLTNGIIAGEK